MKQAEEQLEETVRVNGWRGEGWYTGLADNGEVEAWFSTSAEDFIGGSDEQDSNEQPPEYLGAHCYPDCNIGIMDGYGVDDAEYGLWEFVRVVIEYMNDGEIELLLTELDSWLAAHDWNRFGLYDDLREETDINPKTEVVDEDDALRIASALKNLLAR